MRKIILSFLFLVSACSWRSPQSTFYMMDSAGLQPLSERNMKVAVTRVRVPDILDKAQIVVSRKQSSNYQVRELDILEFHRWAEVFPEVLQNTVTNDLIAYLPKSYVERSYFDSKTARYNINIEINNIQAYEGDKVILEAWWNIKNASGSVVKQDQGRYEVPVKGKGIADLVSAESQAVHQMSKEIAEALIKL